MVTTTIEQLDLPSKERIQVATNYTLFLSNANTSNQTVHLFTRPWTPNDLHTTRSHCPRFATIHLNSRPVDRNAL